MTKEDFEDAIYELVDKYYAEDAMCKSDLFDLLNDYDKLLETAHNSDYTKCRDYIIRKGIKQCRECGRPL